MVLEEHTGSVIEVAWSPNGLYIASAAADLTTIIWNAETGEGAYKMRGHSDTILSVVWFNNGAKLMTGSADGTIRIWDIP